MFKKILYASILGLALVSCTEDLMDDINVDNENPTPGMVDAKFQITDAIMATGFSGWTGAYGWYVSSYTEQTFGTGNNQLMKAELRRRVETAASTTFNNEWNSIYSNLMNIKQIFEKCDDPKLNAGQPDVLGMAHVLWVLNAELLTDLHGDIPYSEALVSMQPKLDKQQDIYVDLLKHCDNAITALDEAVGAGANNTGAQDILYGGDPAKWLGLAHAVKARLYLNMAYRDNANYANAAEAAQDALDAGFDGAEIAVFDGVSTDNAWTAYFWSRYYTGANGTVVSLMDDRDDPRAGLYACDAFESGVSYAAAGDKELAGATTTVGIPLWLMNGAAPIHLFSVSEINFIIAECKARAGQDATQWFAAGVQAAFDDCMAACDEAPFDATEYIESFGTPDLEEIMVQKYLAQTRDEQIQTYNDIRRCKAQGEEFIILNNPNNTQGGMNMWPLRLPYGNSDVIANPNVAAAFGSGNTAGNYLFTENIWLFGGNR